MDMFSYQMLMKSGKFWLLLIKFDLQPFIPKRFNLYSLHCWTYWLFLVFSFGIGSNLLQKQDWETYPNQSNLTGGWLKCCVISASHSLRSGKKKIVMCAISSKFSFSKSQMICAFHLQLSEFAQWMHLLVNCELWIVNCDLLLLDINTIIATHLFELTFEFAPLVKDNALRMRILQQPFIMKQILDVANSSAALTISKCKQSVLSWRILRRLSSS